MDSKKYINKLKPQDKRLIRKIGQIAQKEGVRAFLIGGVVRDLILRRPIKDIDILIEGAADRVADAFAKSNGIKVTKHSAFKTANVSFKNGQSIDFISSRMEKYKKPGVLPQVSHGDLYGDLARRDIAINAMAILITPIGFGRFYDEFNGLNDLKQKKVRVLHANTFYDDPTRIFRVCRYAGRLGFTIDRWTRGLMRAAIKKGALKTITINRYLNELKLVCAESSAGVILKKLNREGALGRIDPRAQLHFRIINRVDAQFNKSKRFADHASREKYLLLALFETLDMRTTDVPLTKELRDCLECNDSISEILNRLSKAKSFSDVYSVLNGFSDFMIEYLFLRTSSSKIQKKIRVYQDKLKGVQIQLNGNDIKKLAVSNAKAIGVIKKQLLLAKIDGKIRLKSEERQLAKRLIAGMKE